jgi:Zn-dependent protease with chaperone function
VTWGSGRDAARIAFTTGLLDALDRIELEAVVGRQLAVMRDGSVDVLTVASALFGPLRVLDGPVASVAHRAIDDRTVVRIDIDGVRATGYPPGLVAALEAVGAGSSRLAGVPRALTGACLAPPGGDPGTFDVHPTLEDRVDLLREI